MIWLTGSLLGEDGLSFLGKSRVKGVFRSWYNLSRTEVCKAFIRVMQFSLGRQECHSNPNLPWGLRERARKTEGLDFTSFLHEELSFWWKWSRKDLPFPEVWCRWWTICMVGLKQLWHNNQCENLRNLLLFDCVKRLFFRTMIMFRLVHSDKCVLSWIGIKFRYCECLHSVVLWHDTHWTTGDRMVSFKEPIIPLHE